MSALKNIFGRQKNPPTTPPSESKIPAPGNTTSEKEKTTSRPENKMTTPIQENLIARNKAYSESFTQGSLPLPPGKKYAIGMSTPIPRIDEREKRGERLMNINL